MADKELNIVVGARDAGASSTLNRIGKQVDTLNKRVGDFGKALAIGAFIDRGFNAINEALTEFRDIQKQVEAGSMTMAVAVETAFSRFAKTLPVIGSAFSLGEQIGEMLEGGTTAAQMAAANAGMATALNIAKQSGDQLAKLEALQRRAQDEASLAGLSPEDAARRRAQFSARDQLDAALALRNATQPGTPARDRADEALAVFDTAIEQTLAAQVDAIEKQLADQAQAAADRLSDLDTQIMIQRLEMNGENFEAQKVRVAADLERKLAKESDPKVQAALKQMADLQIEKINGEIDKAIEDSINAVPVNEAAAVSRLRPRASLLQSQFLTGATGSSPAMREQQKQTQTLEQLRQIMAEIRTAFGQNAVIAVAKGDIRGR